MTTLHPLRQRNLARTIAALGCAALLLGQLLALWHAVAHGQAGDGGPVRVLSAQGADGEPTSAAGHLQLRRAGTRNGTMGSVPGGDAWAHAAGDAACRLVDHLLIGIAGLPTAISAGVCPCPQGHFPVASPAAARGIFAAFQARAPPRG